MINKHFQSKQIKTNEKVIIISEMYQLKKIKNKKLENLKF